MRYQQFTFLNLNTLGTPFFARDIKKRYEKIAEQINAADIDVVCLEELFTYAHLALFKTLLPDFFYVVYKKHVIGPRGGLVLFSKHPVGKVQYAQYRFPTGAYVPWYTKLIGNGILITTLKNLPLTILQTHLSSDINTHNLTDKNTLYTLIRNQSREAADLMNTYTNNHEAVLLAGDFNIAKDSVLYKEFVKQTGATDLFQKFTTPTYFYDHVPYKYHTPTNSRIDFIFLKKAKIKFGTIVTSHMFENQVKLSDGTMSYLSDHIGLKISFSLI